VFKSAHTGASLRPPTEISWMPGRAGGTENASQRGCRAFQLGLGDRGIAHIEVEALLPAGRAATYSPCQHRPVPQTVFGDKPLPDGQRDIAPARVE
jgi:hypothetical protein